MTGSANRGPITEQVRELLNTVLRQEDFPGMKELLRQSLHVEVIGGPITMLDLRVSDAPPASAFADGPIPLSLAVADARGVPVGELLVWVESGYLNALEFSWWTDDPPDRLPTPDCVQVVWDERSDG